MRGLLPFESIPRAPLASGRLAAQESGELLVRRAGRLAADRHAYVPAGHLDRLDHGGQLAERERRLVGDDPVALRDHRQDRELELRELDRLLADLELALREAVLAVELAHHLRVED